MTEIPTSTPRLPDPGTPLGLQLEDATVEKVLRTIAGVTGIPLSTDTEATLKARRIRMTLIAQEAPLETVLAWCARALDTQIFWWPREPIVWIGNSPPPWEHRRFRAWALDPLLGEFRVNLASEVISWQTDQKQLNEDVVHLNQGLRETDENHPPPPPLEELLEQDPFLNLLSNRLEENHGRWTRSWNRALSTPSQKKLENNPVPHPPAPEPPQPALIDWLMADEALGDPWQKWSREEQELRAKKLATELTSLHDTKEILTAMTPMDEEPPSGETLLEQLESSTSRTRLRAYREVLLLSQIRDSQKKQQQRGEQLTAQAREFAHRRDTEAQAILRRLRESHKEADRQISAYLVQKDDQANGILRLATRLAGSSLPLRILGRGQLLMGTVSSWQGAVVDDLVASLRHPTELAVEDHLLHRRLERESLERKRRHLVNNNLRAMTLQSVLVQWARQAGVSMAWTTESLPELGQVLINRQQGMLPFEQSLLALGRHHTLPPPHDDGGGCLWLGTVSRPDFAPPLPLRLNTWHLPSSLRQEGVRDVAHWLAAALSEEGGGTVAVTPHGHLLTALTQREENRVLERLAEVARAGQLPAATVMPKKSAP